MGTVMALVAVSSMRTRAESIWSRVAATRWRLVACWREVARSNLAVIRWVKPLLQWRSSELITLLNPERPAGPARRRRPRRRTRPGPSDKLHHSNGHEHHQRQSVQQFQHARPAGSPRWSRHARKHSSSGHSTTWRRCRSRSKLSQRQQHQGDDDDDGGDGFVLVWRPGEPTELESDLANDDDSACWRWWHCVANAGYGAHHQQQHRQHCGQQQSLQRLFVY